MPASFCWMKLKDASKQPGGEVVNVVESVRDGQQVNFYRSAEAACSCAGAARNAAADHEVSINCVCCVQSNSNHAGWGGRFADAVLQGFEAAALTGADASVWRIEGPSFKGPDGEPDHTLSLSPPFASREEALIWLRGTCGVSWANDALSLGLIAHIS